MRKPSCVTDTNFFYWCVFYIITDVIDFNIIWLVISDSLIFFPQKISHGTHRRLSNRVLAILNVDNNIIAFLQSFFNLDGNAELIIK